MSQYLNHQTPVPSSSIYRGVSPVIFVDASDVLDRAARRACIYGLRLPYVGYGYRTVSRAK